MPVMSAAPATGMHAEMPVPKPGSDSTWSMPARLSMRWRMATRPNPPSPSVLFACRSPSLTDRPIRPVTPPTWAMWTWPLAACFSA